VSLRTVGEVRQHVEAFSDLACVTPLCWSVCAGDLRGERRDAATCLGVVPVLWAEVAVDEFVVPTPAAIWPAATVHSQPSVKASKPAARKRCNPSRTVA